ncbi:hypothetical protein HY479_01375 [Candidatus Uhrbacteria bacterium]|nr:hypothetical protein [Candidatus Uhrbacteria bacterium]
MTNLLFPAAGAGVSAGAILLFFSYIAPYLGAGNFIRDLERPRVFGKPVSRREAYLLGVFSHLFISALAGIGYGVLVVLGLVSGFHLLPLLGWSLVLTLVSGGILLPLEGHGLFGTKEDAWFPVDLVLSNVLWAVLFWWLIRVWFTVAP